MEVDGLVTGYLEAGQGDPVVLLHGGEFGVSAELGWERNIAALAAHYRVLALDMLGFGQSAKVIDFNDGRGMRIRHIARFCDVVGVQSAHFVGNSMGAVNLFVDATSESPLLPCRSLVMICGGGEIQRNEYSAALYDYDATIRRNAAHRRGALLRPGLSRTTTPTCIGATSPASRPAHGRRWRPRRFRRPGLEPPPLPSSKRPYERIAVPTLVVEGGVRQTAAGRLGGRDRQADPERSLGGDRTGRPLPADRTARRRQLICWILAEQQFRETPGFRSRRREL